MGRILIIIWVAYFVVFFCSCKKDDGPKARYTIQGRVYLSYPSRPLAKQSITVTFTAGHASSYESIDLGDATTDDSGYFSITYDALDMSNRSNVDIHIFNQFLQIDGIPINQNVNKNFFIPTSGKLAIYLYTKNPLETNHDTFFLGHFDGSGFNLITDTFLTTINGYWKTSTLPVAGYTLFYGRGSRDYGYNPQINGFSQKSHHIDVSITGYPVIDKLNINY